MLIRRGDIFYVDLNPAKGSEQKGHRPVIIIQNDMGNKVSPTVIVAPLTTKKFSKTYPTNVYVKKGTANLKHDSSIMLSQIRTIDKTRLLKKVGTLPNDLLDKVNDAIAISLGLS